MNQAIENLPVYSSTVKPRSDFRDLTGQKFGRLLVVSRAPNGKTEPTWNCQCECGNVKVIPRTNLRSGQTRSCGCLAIEAAKRVNLTHGMSTKETRGPNYQRYQNMIHRCYDETNHKYPRYGGRGITVCDRWKKSVVNFIADMGEPPDKSMTLERIDNDGPYCPANCRWATAKEQSRNRSTTRFIVIDGKSKTMTEWAKIRGLRVGTISMRLEEYGWSEYDAVMTPIGQRRQKPVEPLQEIEL